MRFKKNYEHRLYKKSKIIGWNWNSDWLICIKSCGQACQGLTLYPPTKFNSFIQFNNFNFIRAPLRWQVNQNLIKIFTYNNIILNNV